MNPNSSTLSGSTIYPRSFNSAYLSSVGGAAASALPYTTAKSLPLQASQICLLVGDRFAHPAIFPDGVSCVSVISSPVEVYVLTKKPIFLAENARLSELKQADEGEEKIENIYPVSTLFDEVDDNETEVNSGTNFSNSPFDPPPHLSESNMIESFESSAVARSTKLSQDSTQLKSDLKELQKDATSSVEERQSDILNDIPKPEPFSVWKCFTFPEIACDPLKSRGFGVCRLTIGTCEVFPYTGPSTISEGGRLTMRSSMMGSASSDMPSILDDMLDRSVTTHGDYSMIPNSLLPFLVVSLGHRVLYRTRVISSSSSWDETIDVDIHSLHSILGLELYDKDFTSSSSIEDEERLGGIRVNISELNWDTPYTTSVEIALLLPPSVAFSTAIKSVPSAIPTAISINDSTMHLSNGSPTGMDNTILPLNEPASDLIETETNPCVNIYIRVSVTLTLTPASCGPRLAQFGASILTDSFEDQHDCLNVSTEAFHIEHTRHMIERLRYIFWDILTIRFLTYWTRLCRWEHPAETGVILCIVWSLFFFPHYTVATFFFMMTTCLFQLPYYLPPLPMASIHSGITDSRGIESTSVSSAALIFMSSFITDSILLDAKKYEKWLTRLVCIVESVYERLRDAGSVYRHYMLIMSASLMMISASFPDAATRVVRITCLSCVVFLIFYTLCPQLLIFLRIINACFLICMRRKKQLKVETY